MRALCISVLLAFSPALLLADTSQERTKEAPRLRSRISIDVEKEKLVTVLAKIREQTGKTIRLDPAVKARLTISLRDISWRDAVLVIARQTRCKVRHLRGGGLYLYRKPRVSIQFTDASVRTVILLLADYANKSIVIGPEVRGRVTLDLRNVEWDRALRAVVQSAGDYALVGEGRLATVEPSRKRDGTLAGFDTLSGEFVFLKGSLLRIKTPRGVISCRLSANKGTRGRLQQVLKGLSKGARILVTYERQENKRVVNNLIAAGE